MHSVHRIQVPAASECVSWWRRFFGYEQSGDTAVQDVYIRFVDGGTLRIVARDFDINVGGRLPPEVTLLEKGWFRSLWRLRLRASGFHTVSQSGEYSSYTTCALPVCRSRSR